MLLVIKLGHALHLKGDAKASINSTTRTTKKTNQMTHFTEIKTQIKDIEALRLACQELGLTLLQNADARGY
jgi:hypothetical protein